MGGCPRLTVSLLLTLAAITAGAACRVEAQAWPTRPIRWLVPVAAGGATDVIARLLQEPVGQRLGTTIVVENRPGGAGIIATQATVSSAPDGHTMGLIYTSHVVNPSMQPNVPYDSARDISPIAFLWRAQLAFVVLADSPIKSLADLLAAARLKPGSLAYATGGVGTGAHLAAALFASVADISLSHAAYRGAALALNDMLGGHVPILVGNVLMLPPYVAAGRIRVLAVSGARRSPVLPDVPTVAELGFPNYEATEWSGLIGPANLPAEVAAQMNAAVNSAIKLSEVAEQYRKMGLEAIAMSPNQFRDFLIAEAAKYTDLIRKSGIKPE